MTTQRVTGLHAHIYDAAGDEAGTVTWLQNWSYYKTLDGAGEYEFSTRATADYVALLTEGRRADVYGCTGGTAEQLLSSGRIEGIEPEFNLSATNYVIKGRDRMGELADRLIVGLNVLGQEWTYIGENGAVRWIDSLGVSAERDLVEAYDGTLATYTDQFGIGDHWWLYVGYMMPFVSMRISFETYNSSDEDTRQYQYYSASTGWTNCANLVDGTMDGTYGFRQDGTITWDRPTDWARNTPTASSGSWYWWRFRADIDAQADGMSQDIQIKEIEIYADKPTTDGLNMIMAYAPDGWKQSGYAQSDGSAYGVITDYTVLQAVEWLREQLGGHFKYSVADGTAQIDWITTFESSGYTADGSGDL